MTFSLKKIFKIFREKGHICYYCGEDAETLDHFIPLAKGGNSKDKNLIPSCRRCNYKKQARTLEHFRELEIRRVNNMPKFLPEHIKFLKRYNFELPKFKYKFWFEINGKPTA